MGQSTDAILAWGIQFEAEEDLPWAALAEEAGFDDADSEEAMAFLLCGVSRPETPFEDDQEVWKAYWSAQTAALEEYGIEIVRHCSGDYPMHMLAISDSKKRAHRGYPVEIDGEHLDVFDDWPSRMIDACAKLGIENPEPKWWLQSNWN